jgi:hypothetical protein
MHHVNTKLFGMLLFSFKNEYSAATSGSLFHHIDITKVTIRFVYTQDIEHEP